MALGQYFTPGLMAEWISRTDVLRDRSEASPVWACHSAVGQGLHDDASNVPSLALTMTTCSTRRIVRLDADRLYLHALRRLRASRTPLEVAVVCPLQR